VVESRKVSSRDKIKNKRILESLETTKQVEPAHHRQQAPTISFISEITKDAVKTIRNLPLEYVHLKTVLQLISKFKLQLDKATDSLKIEFGMVLFRKAAQIL
jgi:hypothetical protein